MKTNVIGRQYNAFQYVFTDSSERTIKKWLSRLFWIAVHTLTLFFIYSCITSFAGSDSSTLRAASKPPITVVQSAIVFPTHESAPNPNEVLKLVNQRRVDAGVAPLSADASLSALAESRAQDMAGRSYYAHQNPDGKTFYDLLTDQGITPSFACENLSLEPNNTPYTAIDSWLKSVKGHKECMLDPNVKSAGYASIKMYDASVNGMLEPYYVIVGIHSTAN